MALPLCAQDRKANAVADKASITNATNATKRVSVGAFSVKVPENWTAFTSGEASILRRQYLDQSRQIYQQFSGVSEDPAQSVDVAAFHIQGDAGSFALVSFKVPPQADLIRLLKSQVREKMDWGVSQGYIRKYLGMELVDDGQLSGFYTKTIGKRGNFEVSAGLEHKKLKNTIIQLTMLSPNSWDEAKSTNTLSSILKSVALKSDKRD